MIDQIRARLQPVFEKHQSSLTAVYLFGSTVTGNVSPQSDLDIAILLQPDTENSAASLRFTIFADISRVLHRNDIDLVILNSSTNLILKDEIIRNGFILFETDVNTREVFEERILHCSIDFRYQRMMAMGV